MFRNILKQLLFVLIILLSGCVGSTEEDIILNNDSTENQNEDIQDEIPTVTEPVVCEDGLYLVDGDCITYAETCEFGYNIIFDECVESVINPDAPSGLEIDYTDSKNTINSYTITNVDYDVLNRQLCFDFKWELSGYNNPRLTIEQINVITNMSGNITSVNLEDVSSIYNNYLCIDSYYNDVAYKLRFNISYTTSMHTAASTTLLTFSYIYHSIMEESMNELVYASRNDTTDGDTYVIEALITDPYEKIISIQVIAIDNETKEPTGIEVTYDPASYRTDPSIYIPDLTVTGLLPNQFYEFQIYITTENGVQLLDTVSGIYFY